MSNGLRRLRALPVLWRTFGWRAGYRRALHELRRRLGRYKSSPARLPSGSFGRRTVPYGPRGRWSEVNDGQRSVVLERGRRVVDGWYEAFGAEWRRLPRSVEDWYRHPFVDFHYERSDWWNVELLRAGVDVKDVWEPARFGWAYDLIRAHALTGDERFAAAFYERLAGWKTANPPFKGPHWACGQETAIRALAILHAEDSLPIPSETAQNAAAVVAVLSWSAERIADAIGYGLSQRNNHGVSEAAALVHLGLRLRGVDERADRWVERGACLLDEQICDQFAPDGWYSQHSFTYMRVALEQALYAQRALQFDGRSLGAGSLSRIDAAIRLLSALADPRNGEVPNHGANDGGRALPFATCGYRDFRPLLTLAAVIRRSGLPADLTPDTDVVQWLGAVPGPASAPRKEGITSGPSGWAAGRVGRYSFFLRAGAYTHRPSHMDALHLDVRVEGLEIVTDPGTYAYNRAYPWNNGLVAAEVHNGPLLAGEVLAERGPRFLWLSWPRARLSTIESSPGRIRLVAQRPGLVQREVIVESEGVRVRDSALTAASPTLQVTWLLHPDVVGQPLSVSGAQVLEAREGDVTAWYSPTYGVRNRARAVRVVRDIGEGSAGIETTIRC